MAFDAGSVVAHVKADISDFKRGIDTAKNEVNDFGNIAGRVGGIVKTALFVGATAAAGGMVLLGKSALQAAGNFEQTKIAFETMLGSVDKATKLLSDLQTFAKKTPFNLVELQETTKRLLAYGVEGDKVIDTLTTLGNIASAVGRDKMPQLTLAFGQVKAVGHLTGMELRQFAETGVPLLQILADKFKVSTSDMQDMISKGEIGFPAVQQALESLGGASGKWGDMMGKQSQTLQGSFSNLQDSWTQLLVMLGTIFIPVATQVVQTLTGFLTPIMQVVSGTKTLAQAFGLSAEQTKMLEAVLTEFKSFLFDTLVPAIQSVAAFIAFIWTENKDVIIAVWTIILGFIQIAWALIYGLLKVGLELLAGDWKGAWQAVLQATRTAWNGIKSIFEGALSFIKAWGGSILSDLVRPFEDAWNKIKDFVNKIKDALDFTKKHSPSVVDIVNNGVRLVNKALDGLAINTSLTKPVVASGMLAGSNSSNVTSININLEGAIIADSQSAGRLAELLGDKIIQKLQKNIRF